MNCPTCGANLRANARFCPECGAAQRASPPTRLVSSGPRLVSSYDYEQEIPLGTTPLVIGRRFDADLPLMLPYASKSHAQVLPHKGGYAIEDLGSLNGTFINGRKLIPNKPIALKHGDVIRIGDSLGNSMNFAYLDSADLLPAWNTIELGDQELGQSAAFRIGRDPASDLPIQSPVVSWQHAEVRRTAGRHQIIDLGSTNGTYVNGKRVRDALLQPGDLVQIGPYQLVYKTTLFQQAPNDRGIRLDCSRLYKFARSRQGTKVILNEVSLSVLPGEFVALVGGSGAGKSTLMDALNGSRRAQSGRVQFNGDDLYPNYDAYRSMIGYVPQSDILHTGLTIRSALRYTAMLRLPPDVSRSEVDQRIGDALDQVSMTDRIDQKIATLSGGQRKRVSIASELLSEPSVFFLDEPTSGLDPGLDKKMMSTLNRLADSGRTVILTTHATNNIQGQCDLVAFMAYGRLVYYGPPAGAMRFFEVGDFADIYSKLESKEAAVDWYNRFRGEAPYQQPDPDYETYVLKRQPPKNPGTNSDQPKRKGFHRAGGGVLAGLRQFGILVQRYLDLVVHDLFSLGILLGVMPIIGLFLLLIANPKSFVGDTGERITELLREQGYYQIVSDSQRLLFMLALSAILLGVFGAAYEIIKEKVIYQRERMVNLRIVPYVLSKVTVLLGFGLLQCAALLAVVGLGVAYPANGILLPAVLEIYITLVLALLVGISMGLFISAIVKNSNMVIYLVLIVLFLQIIFSGVLFSLPAFARPISYLTPARWAMEGLGVSVNMEQLNTLSQNFVAEVAGRKVNETVDSPVEFDVNYSRDKGHLLETWAVQAAFACFYLLLTVLVLHRQDDRSDR